MRSMSPSTTRVWTRTESPTRNAGNSVLNCSFSMASMMRFMAAPFRGRSISADARQTQVHCSRLARSRRFGCTRQSAVDTACGGYEQCWETGLEQEHDYEHEQEQGAGFNGCDRASGKYNRFP